MKKILLATIVILGMGSCISPMNPKVPWLIYSKTYREFSSGTVCNYSITDGNTKRDTEDSCNKYNVGDTVKH